MKTKKYVQMKKQGKSLERDIMEMEIVIECSN